MKKKLVYVLIVLLVLSISATFAYITTQFKTNNATIKISTQENVYAYLYAQESGKLLIPYNSIATDGNEVFELTYTLRVDHTTNVLYTVTHNLPEQYSVTYNTSTFRANEIYIVTVKLLEPVSSSTQTFYFNIQLS